MALVSLAPRCEIRKLKAAIGEGLHSPNLCRENPEGAKRLIRLWKWNGPVALQTDCTKVCLGLAMLLCYSYS